MLPILFTAIASNVVTIFSLFRLFLQADPAFDTLLFAFNNILWNTTLTAPIFMAIYISAKINNTVGCLIYCQWGRVKGDVVESPLTDNFGFLFPLLLFFQTLQNGEVLNVLNGYSLRCKKVGESEMVRIVTRFPSNPILTGYLFSHFSFQFFRFKYNKISKGFRANCFD